MPGGALSKKHQRFIGLSPDDPNQCPAFAHWTWRGAAETRDVIFAPRIPTGARGDTIAPQRVPTTTATPQRKNSDRILGLRGQPPMQAGRQSARPSYIGVSTPYDAHPHRPFRSGDSTPAEVTAPGQGKEMGGWPALAWSPPET